MSAVEVTDRLCEAIRSERNDLIILNYANGDMVGHTGVYKAICNAVGCIDGCVETTVTCALNHGYTVLLTADHGNADQMMDYENNQPFTKHTTNPVPFILINGPEGWTLREGGRLCDIAPTLLELLGLPQPEEMTGESLLEHKLG